MFTTAEDIWFTTAIFTGNRYEVKVAESARVIPNEGSVNRRFASQELVDATQKRVRSGAYTR